jgi:hypothetical protein
MLTNFLGINNENLDDISKFLSSINTSIDGRVDIKINELRESLDKYIQTPSNIDLSTIRPLIKELSSMINTNLESLIRSAEISSEALVKSAEASSAAAISAVESAHSSSESAHESKVAAEKSNEAALNSRDAVESAIKIIEASSESAKSSETNSNLMIKSLNDIADKILTHISTSKESTQSSKSNIPSGIVINNNHTFDMPINNSNRNLSEGSDRLEGFEKYEESEESEEPEEPESEEELTSKRLKIIKQKQDEEKRLIRVISKALRKTSYNKKNIMVNSSKNKHVTNILKKPHQKGGSNSVTNLINSMKTNSVVTKTFGYESKINNYFNIIDDLYLNINIKLDILKKKSKIYNESEIYDKLFELIIDTQGDDIERFKIKKENLINEAQKKDKEIEKEEEKEKEKEKEEDADDHWGGNNKLKQNGGMFNLNQNIINIFENRNNEDLEKLLNEIIKERRDIYNQISLNNLPEINILINNLLSKVKIVINILDLTIKGYEYISGNKIIDDYIVNIDKFDIEINTLINETKNYKLKYDIDINSIEFKYIYTTINRINIAIDLYKHILHSAIHARKKGEQQMIEFKHELNQGYQRFLQKSKMVEEFKEYLTIIDGYDLNYNVWHIIIKIDKIIENQIRNYNYTTKSIIKAKEILEKKKEIIAEIHENPIKQNEEKFKDFLKDEKYKELYDKIDKFIKEFTNIELSNNNIKDELTIFENINKIEDDHNNVKEYYINKTYKLPDHITSDEEKLDDKDSLNIDFDKKHDSHIKIIDILNLSSNIEKYIKTIEHAKHEIINIIHNYIAINTAKKHNIEIFKNITCKNERSSIISFDSNSRTYEGRVLDIFDNNEEPTLKIKEKNKNIIKIVPLKSCKEYNKTKEELEEEENANNLEAAKYAAKLGFNADQQVLCLPKLSIIEKYWHKFSQQSIIGKITKFTTKIDRLGRTRIKVALNGKPELYHLENCEPEFEHTLDKLDNIKKSNFVKKLLEKLKMIINQIESLNPSIKDYDIKLKLLSIEYDNIKSEIDKLFKSDNILEKSSSPSSSPSSIETQTDPESSKLLIQETVELRNNEKELSKLTKKRKELERVLMKNNPRIIEQLYPEKTIIPKNLIHGGHKMIQHAGSINYIQLKETINNVSLDDILLQSKPLFHQMNKN